MILMKIMKKTGIFYIFVALFLSFLFVTISPATLKIRHVERSYFMLTPKSSRIRAVINVEYKA